MKTVTSLLLLLSCFAPAFTKEYKSQIYASAYDRDRIPAELYRPSKPLMWTALLSVDRAANAGWEYKLYERNKVFELFGGFSGSYMETYYKKPDSIYVASAYLLFKLYLLKTDYINAFLLYSPAGPSLLSKNTFSETAFTNNFVFQNQLGAGVSFGRDASFEFFTKMYHFSNGDTFPVNGGIDIPIVLGIIIKL